MFKMFGDTKHNYFTRGTINIAYKDPTQHSIKEIYTLPQKIGRFCLFKLAKLFI